MPNPHRGEAAFTFAGRQHMLRLTLGSLAELEDALGANGLSALSERLAGGRLSARDICAVLAAGMRGAGSQTTASEVGEMLPASALVAAAEATAALLLATFGSGAAPNPTQPQEDRPPHAPHNPFHGMRP